MDIETDFISLSKDGILLIKKGYAWDGPSGPAFDTKSFMRASLIHDVLYQLIRLEKLSKEDRLIADLELKRICIEDGMNKIFAKIVYIYVRTFSEPFIDPSIEHEIEIAP